MVGHIPLDDSVARLPQQTGALAEDSIKFRAAAATACPSLMKNRKVLVLEKRGQDFFALCWNAKYLRNEGMILLILMVLAELRGPAPGKKGEYLFNDHSFGDIQAQIQFQTVKGNIYILSFVSW